MKMLIVIIAAIILITSPASAQSPYDAPRVTVSWMPLGKVSGGLAVSSTSSRVAVTKGNTAWICNTGANDAYLSLGNSSIVATPTGSTWLKSGTCSSYSLQLSSSAFATYVAAITSSSTTTLSIETGIGSGPVLSSSSGGGGGGGAVYGPTDTGSPAVNPPVVVGGTEDGSASGSVNPWKVGTGGIGFINCANCSGSGISVAYGGAIGSVGTPNGYKDASGNFQPILGDTTNGQWVSIKSSVAVPVTGTFWQATQPVSGTVTANLGTLNGAATAAAQSTGNASLSSIDGKTPALGQALAAASVPVILPAATITTLTPPTTVTANLGTLNGAATASNQSSQITQETAINTVTGTTSDAAATAGSTGTVSAKLRLMTTQLDNINTNVQGAIPAGTNLIGKVGIDQTTPGTTNGVQVNAAIPAGTNIIGAVQPAPNQTPTDCSGTITTGATAQNAFSAGATKHGFTIVNLDTTEPMWISFTTTAAANTVASYPIQAATPTTFAGAGSFTTPNGFGINTALSVIAATTGHKFSCTWW